MVSQHFTWSIGSQFGIPSAASGVFRYFSTACMGSFSWIPVVFSEEEGGTLSSVYSKAWDELKLGRMSVGAEIRGRIAMGWAYWIIPDLAFRYR